MNIKLLERSAVVEHDNYGHPVIFSLKFIQMLGEGQYYYNFRKVVQEDGEFFDTDLPIIIDSFKTIDDYSDLKNIENLKGYETFEAAGNNEQKWDAKGNDIYYQGTTDKPLPVEMKITYRLDGKSIGANDIKGKSGHVNIRFDFTNNEYEMCKIDGKEEKIYVPFTVITGSTTEIKQSS